ncbi:MAG: HYR domain-containing protein, partial [Bacteroidota bacterium]
MLLVLSFARPLSAQSFNERIKLTDAQRADNDEMGRSVSISGNYAIVGIPFDDDAPSGPSLNNAGSVIIYERNASGNWVEVQKLTAADRENEDLFGSSVSIDGNYAIVGSTQDDEDPNGNSFLSNSGAAYIFERESNGTWTQVQKVTSNARATGFEFGRSVAISASGVAVVGTPKERVNGDDDAGTATIFTRNGNGSWSFTTKFDAVNEEEDDAFGWSVAINGDYILVGAIGEDEDNGFANRVSGAGSVYVFERSLFLPGIWSLKQNLTASDRESNDGFGNAVAIDGNRLVIGAQSEDDDESGNNNLNSAGSAYVFELNGSGNWVQVDKLVSADRAATDLFGSSVDISGDFIIVGAPLEDQNENGQIFRTSAGSAYIYERSGSGNWSQIQKIVNSDRTQRDNFGHAVGVSGTYLLIGARQEDDDDDNGLSDAGAAYIFEQNMAPVAVCQNLTIAVNGNCEDVVVIPEDFDNGSTDPNGDNLTFTLNMSGPFPIGITNLVLTVSDGELSANCNVSLTVVDDSPPTLVSAETVLFQNGTENTGGIYADTDDTYLLIGSPDENRDTNFFFVADNDLLDHAALQFGNIIGAAPGQIPTGVTVTSAVLSLGIYNPGDNAVDLEIARILGAWDASTATWNNFTLNGNAEGGIQRDGVEATTTLRTFSSAVGRQHIDVTEDVQAWVDGLANHGWAIFNPSSNGATFYSSEASIVDIRPSLTISYIPIGGSGSCASFNRQADPGACSYTVVGDEFDPDVFDNCEVTILQNDYNAESSLADAVFPIGTTNVSFEAIDAAGNIAECSFAITIVDGEAPFLGEDFSQTLEFRDGVSNAGGVYEDTEDTDLKKEEPDEADGSSIDIVADNDPLRQGLLQFKNIFGTDAGQLPSGAIITSAILTLDAFNQGGAGVEMSRVLGAWDETTATWNNFTLNGNTEGGVQQDGVEATAPLRLISPTIGVKEIDVTEDVQGWSDSGNNNGWAFFNPSNNGFEFESSNTLIADLESRPKLTITYLLPEDTNPCVSFTRFPNEVGCTYLVNGDEFDPPTTDNCGVFSIENNFNNSMSLEGEILPLGVTTVTFTIEDEASNTNTCTFDIEILPPPPPSFTISNPIFCEDEGSSIPSVMVSPVDGVFSGPGVTDNGNGEDFTFDPALAGIGTHIITYTFTDPTTDCTSTKTTEVEVFDTLHPNCNEAPNANCQSIEIDLTNEDPCIADLTAEDFDDGSSDPDGNMLTFSISPEGPFLPGETRVLFIASDGGLSDTCVTSVIATDNTPPVFVDCPEDMTISTDPSECFATFSFDLPSIADDACNDPIVDLSLEATLLRYQTQIDRVTSIINNQWILDANDIEETIIEDGGGDAYDNGNEMNTNAASIIPYSEGMVTSSDAFGIGSAYFTQYNEGVWMMAADINQLSFYEITGGLGADRDGVTYTFERTYNAPDGTVYYAFFKGVTEGENDPSVNHVIIVPSTPGITQTITNDTNDDFHRVDGLETASRIYQFNWYGRAAGDVSYAYYDLEINEIIQRFIATVVHPHAFVVQTEGTESGSRIPFGTTDFEFAAVDIAGNTTTCGYAVTVQDTEAPVADCPADTVLYVAADNCLANFEFTEPVFSDNCLLASAANILFVSDNSNETEIPAQLMDAGYSVTIVTSDYAGNDTEDNIVLQGDLSDYGIIYWHAVGEDFGDVHSAATIDNLEAYVQAGGNLFITGGDVIASPFDPLLENLIGGRGANDTPSDGNATYTILGPANAVNSGQFDVVDLDPANVGDEDAITSLSSETVTVFDSDEGARWTLRTTPGGLVAFVSTDQFSSNSFEEWETPGSGFYEALRNFAFNITQANQPIVVEQTAGPDSGEDLAVGETIFTFAGMDEVENVGLCSFTVTVLDTIPPMVTCPADIITTADDGLCGTNVNFATPVSDNCPDVTLTVVPASGSFFDVGTTTVMVTATDASGNITSCSFDVTVEDNEVPVFSNCPADIVQDNDPGECSAVVTYAPPTGTDNCSIISTTEITFNLTTDGFSNETGYEILDTSTGNRVASNGPNVYAANSNIEEQIALPNGDYEFVIFDTFGDGICCDFGNGNYSLTVEGTTINSPSNGAFGDSEAITFSITTATGVIQTAGLPSGAEFPVGTTTNTFVITDNAGNADTCSFDVTINDLEAPMVTSCPVDIVVNNDPGVCEAEVTYTLPTATENCTEATPTGFVEVNITFDAFRADVSFEIVDANTSNVVASGGSYSSAGSSVTESFVLPPGSYEFTIFDSFGDGICCFFGGGTYNIIVDGETTVSPSGGQYGSFETIAFEILPQDFSVPAVQTAGLASGSTFPVGTTTNTFVFMDDAGNTASCSFDVTVNDTEAPTAECPLLVAYLDDNGQAILPQNANEWASSISDNCDPNPQAFFADELPPVLTCEDIITDFSGLGGELVLDDSLGADDGFKSTADAAVPLGNEARTLSLRINPRVEPYCFGCVAQLGQGNCTGEQFGLGLRTGSNLLTFWGGCLDFTSNLAVPIGEESYIAVVYDGNRNITLYLNEASESTTLDEDLNTLAASLFAGIQTINNGASFIKSFEGSIDEVRVYDRALTPLEIANDRSTANFLDPTTPNLVAYYPLDEVSGTEVLDLAGGNNGSFIGHPLRRINSSSTSTPVDLILLDSSENEGSCTVDLVVLDSISPLVAHPDTILYLDSDGLASLAVQFMTFDTTENCVVNSVLMERAPGTGNASSILDFDCQDLNNPVEILVTATDQSGNVGTTSFLATILDSLAPEITCVSDTVLYVDQSGFSTLDFRELIITASDNCGLDSLFPPPAPFVVNCEAAIQSPIVFTDFTMVADESGNRGRCDISLTVLDTISPVLVCSNDTVEVNADCEIPLEARVGAWTLFDNCQIAAVSETYFDENGTELFSETFAGDFQGNFFTILESSLPLGLNTIELVATDASGLTDSCSFTVLAVDASSPTLICPPTLEVFLGAGNVTGQDTAFTDIDFLLANGFFKDDNCDPDPLGPLPTIDLITQREFNCDDVGQTISRDYYLIDEYANSSDTCTVELMILDSLPPTVTCVDTTIYLDANGQADFCDIDLFTTADNCEVDFSTFDQCFLVECSDAGATDTIPITVFDGSGNSSSCHSFVTTLDTILPVISCIDTTIYLDADGVADYCEIELFEATDNCAVDLLANDQCFISECEEVDSTLVLPLTVFDVNGNSSNCTATVTVLDTIAPQIITIPDTILYLDELGMAALSIEDVVLDTVENCIVSELELLLGSLISTSAGENVSQRFSSSRFVLRTELRDRDLVRLSVAAAAGSWQSGSNVAARQPQQLFFNCDDAGNIYEVLVKSTDQSGNMDTTTLQVTILDTLPPIVSCLDTTVYLDDDGLANYCDIELFEATDNCAVDLMPFDQCFVVGCDEVGSTIELPINVFDVNSNNSMCTATVIVLDTIRPTLACNSPRFVQLDDNGEATVPVDVMNFQILADDNCGVDESTFAEVSGLSELTFDCDDVFADTSFMFTIEDVNGNVSDACTVSIIVEDLIPPVVTCPDDATIECDEDPSPANTGEATAIDNCSAEITFEDESTQTDDGCGQFNYTITRSWIATDPTGNADTCTQIITVEDTKAPIPVCNSISIEIDDRGEYTLSQEETDAIAAGSADNCDADFTYSLDQTEFDCSDVDFDLGAEAGVEVELTVVDCSGNDSTCVALIEFLPAELSYDYACIGDINITLDEDCQATLVPEMLLSGDQFCLDLFEFEITVMDDDPSNGPIVDGCGDFQYMITEVGDYFTLTNFETCWGTIHAEDKTSPVIADLPEAPAPLYCYAIDGININFLPANVSRCWIQSGADGTTLNASMSPLLRARLLAGGGIPNFTDGCSDVEICVNDIVDDNGDCADVVIERTFTATDGISCEAAPEGGNDPAVATYEIIFTRPSIDDVDAINTTATFECDETFETLTPNQFGDENPAPQVEDYPFFIGPNGPVYLTANFCNIGATFQDGPRIETCPQTYKFVRTFTVIDWCNPGQIETFTQLVKVGDFDAPDITAPTQDLNFDGVADEGPLFFSTSNPDCSANFLIPAGNATDNCDPNPAVIALIYPGGDLSGAAVGPFAVGGPAFGIPVGDHVLRYIATDACDNADTLDVDIRIGDRTAPVAICEDGLDISLGGAGVAQLCGEDIDQASYDECSDITRYIARVGDNNLPIPGTTWEECIQLTCDEIGIVRVGLLVVDAAGNENSCWLDVLVEDKLPPLCVAPGPITTTCDDEDLGTLPQDLEAAFAADAVTTAAQLDGLFGAANGVDNCPTVMITQTVIDGRNACGVGLIVRNFVVEDGQGFTSTGVCRQTITVLGVHDYTVIFPADAGSEECIEPDYNGVAYDERGC